MRPVSSRVPQSRCRFIACALLSVATLTTAWAADEERTVPLLAKDLQECAIAYAREHLTSRLTATELSIAAASACLRYSDALHARYLADQIAMIKDQRLTDLRREELKSQAYALAEEVQRTFEERARNAVLRFIADETLAR